MYLIYSNIYNTHSAKLRVLGYKTCAVFELECQGSALLHIVFG